MYAEIVSVGDEILIGQIINTNAVFIAKEFEGGRHERRIKKIDMND